MKRIAARQSSIIQLSQRRPTFTSLHLTTPILFSPPLPPASGTREECARRIDEPPSPQLLLLLCCERSLLPDKRDKSLELCGRSEHETAAEYLEQQQQPLQPPSVLLAPWTDPNLDCRRCCWRPRAAIKFKRELLAPAFLPDRLDVCIFDCLYSAEHRSAIHRGAGVTARLESQQQPITGRHLVGKPSSGNSDCGLELERDCWEWSEWC